MTHVNNRFSGYKTFSVCFIISMIITTIAFYSYCGNTIAKEPEKKVDTHEVTIESSNDITEETKVSVEPMTPVAVEKEEPTTVIEETTTIVEETNTHYYVNDNGYKAYLDKQYQNHLYDMCKKYNVEQYYTLFMAQMYHESTFRQHLVSKTNDYGLMQINVCNHKWLSEKLGFTDFLNPYNSIEAGVYMMSNYLHKYNDVEKALVCYNSGESVVRKGTYSTKYSRGVLDDMKLLIELN